MWYRATRHDIPLVREEGEVSAYLIVEATLPPLYLVEDCGAFFRCIGAQVELNLIVIIAAEARQPDRHNAHRLYMRVERGEVLYGAVQLCAIIQAGAKDKLGVSLDT